MVTYDQALESIKKTFPKCRVLKEFDYDNRYNFQVVTNAYIEDIGKRPVDSRMGTSHIFSVDKQNGNVTTFDYQKLWNDGIYLGKLLDKAKTVESLD